MTSHKPDFNDTKTAFAFRGTDELQNAVRFFRMMQNPWVSSLGQRALKISLYMGLPVKGFVRKTLYRHFCGGETFEQSFPLIKKLGEYGVYSVLDYGVEGQNREEEMDKVADEIIFGIKTARDEDRIPFTVFKATSIGFFGVYEKVTSGRELTAQEAQYFENTRSRMMNIFQKGYEYNVPVFVDAEESWIQKAIDDLVYEGMERFNKEKTIVWNTYQLYRNDHLEHLENHIRKGRENGFRIGAKLVRGAYLEKEIERAKEKGYRCPVHVRKSDTDRDFNQSMLSCLENIDVVSFHASTHNETSCQMLLDEMEKRGFAKDDKRIWFSQLYGMCDYISFNLAAAGYNVCKYVPYGPLEAVLPYLMRRAEENSSVEGQAQRELELLEKELERRRNEGE